MGKREKVGPESYAHIYLCANVINNMYHIHTTYPANNMKQTMRIGRTFSFSKNTPKSNAVVIVATCVGFLSLVLVLCTVYCVLYKVTLSSQDLNLNTRNPNPNLNHDIYSSEAEALS